MRFTILVAVSLCLVASSTSAETIAHCGKSIGKEYTGGNKWADVDGSIFPETTIVQTGPDYDVLFRDPFGMRSVRSERGTVVRVEGYNNREITLVVVYPLGSVETYQLTIDQSGRGQLLWTNLKHFGLVDGKPIGGFYVADCSK